MPLVGLNDTAIFYQEQGAGPPLIFVPGLGASQEMWEPQVAIFRRSHRVISLDARGSGRSGRLRGWRGILPRQAADLAALLDHLQIGRAAVCGVSFGGVLAQRFALDYPERCAGLVVVDSFSDTRPRSIGGLLVLAGAYLGAPLYLLPGRWLVPLIRVQYDRWPLAQRHLERIVRELRGWETLKVRLAINAIDLRSELRRLRCPALGIVGDASPVAVGLMRRFAAAAHARLAVVPDSFDPTNLCQPEAFNRLLAEFLAEIGWVGD